jgi:hypothetical protein
LECPVWHDLPPTPILIYKHLFLLSSMDGISSWK